jgi:hypothetical protein
MEPKDEALTMLPDLDSLSPIKQLTRYTFPTCFPFIVPSFDINAITSPTTQWGAPVQHPCRTAISYASQDFVYMLHSATTMSRTLITSSRGLRITNGNCTRTLTWWLMGLWANDRTVIPCEAQLGPRTLGPQNERAIWHAMFTSSCDQYLVPARFAREMIPSNQVEIISRERSNAAARVRIEQSPAPDFVYIFRTWWSCWELSSQQRLSASFGCTREITPVKFPH